MSTVVVLGATGRQGGGVVDALQKNSKWQVRGVTRNVNSGKAKTLAAKGVEIVQADVNQVDSLTTAFEGATAIFAVTDFWAEVFTAGLAGAADIEGQQLINIATAASKVSTLKHFVLSALPNTKKYSNGKHSVPHMDAKERGIEWMTVNAPDLLAKMTAYWPGWYGNNIAEFMRLMPVPGSEGYIWAQPATPETLLPITGEISTNTGRIVDAILEAGAKAHGKIVVGVTEYMRMDEVAKLTGKAAGKSAAYAELSNEGVEALWGPIMGTELAAQFRFHTDYPDMHGFEADKVMSFAELGLEGKLMGFESFLETVKGQLV